MALSSCKIVCSGISQKWIFVIMAFLSVWILNCIRVILSITITKMVPPPKEMNGKLTDDTCPGSEQQAFKNTTIINEVYDWDEYTQGLILSSYFWGYTIGQFPVGYLSERFGGKHLLGFGTFLPSVLTLMIPYAITWGSSAALISIRAAIGILNSSMYPASSTIIAHWTATSAERSKVGSIIVAAGILGTVFGTTTPAILMTHTGMGWQGVFYFFGIIGVIWFPLWTLLCYNRPEEHPFISDVELKNLKNEMSKEKIKKLPPAPWKFILKSKEYWAFVLALIGLDWAYYTMTSDLPKYMNDVVKLSIESNGNLVSLSYLLMWFNTMFSSWLRDKIIAKKWMSPTVARKLFVTVGLMSSAIVILAASYAECDQFLVVTMFILGMVLMGVSYSTIMTNNLDLSPNYAGSVIAVASGIGAVGGVLTPYVVGSLTPNQTISEWRLVYWIVFGVSAFTTLSFVICGSGKVQKWDDPSFMKNEKDQKNEDLCEKQPELNESACEKQAV